MEKFNELPKNNFPELYNAPTGVVIQEELSVGKNTSSSDIYRQKFTRYKNNF